MRDAVTKHVPDGASVALGCALEPAIPFAFAHELIRQRRRDLHLIGPISDIAFDQLIGAGCVAVVSAAWVGNVSAGLAHAYRRAANRGSRSLELFDRAGAARRRARRALPPDAVAARKRHPARERNVP